jgi:PAS domain S-box-containing protein
MANPISSFSEHEFDSLELATIEVRWVAVAGFLAVLVIRGQLSLISLALACAALAYNSLLSIYFHRHHRHWGSKSQIVISDLALFGLFTVAVADRSLLFSLLLLFPVIASASWFNLAKATLVAAAADLILLIALFWGGKWGSDQFDYLLLFILVSASITYLIGKVTETEISQRSEVQTILLELERDKARLTALIDGIGDGMLALDRNGRVIFFNIAAAYLLGHPEDDLVGEKIETLLPAKQGIDDYDLLKNTFHTGAREQRDDLEFLVRGNPVRLYTSVAPILASNGDIRGAIVLCRDITREKNEEEERTAFAAVAAHEIRTPLTVIEGYLSYLLNSKKLHYDKASREYIERAHTSVIELAELITDLLKVSRAEAGKLEANFAPADLVDILKGTAEAFKKPIADKGLKLKLVLPDKKIIIPTDGEKVMEVANNYLENAVKFTEKGEVALTLKEEKGWIRVEVSDQGIGLSSIDQARIWQKFYRAENWRTRKTGGTGLGLYICKRWVELLGGQVGVRSRDGEGATFYFTLPRKPIELAKKKAMHEAVIAKT